MKIAPKTNPVAGRFGIVHQPGENSVPSAKEENNGE